MIKTEAGTDDASAPELFSATDLCAISDRKQREEAEAARTLRQAAEEERRHQRELFMAQKLTPDFISLVMTRLRKAAESGQTEIMIGHFPSAWCTDGGRKINAPEDSWPDTLQGIAKEFYEFWQRTLKPRGFHLRVQIIDFPGGIPGDVGAFLSWRAPLRKEADHG